MAKRLTRRKREQLLRYCQMALRGPYMAIDVSTVSTTQTEYWARRLAVLRDIGVSN